MATGKKKRKDAETALYGPKKRPTTADAGKILAGIMSAEAKAPRHGSRVNPLKKKKAKKKQ